MQFETQRHKQNIRECISDRVVLMVCTCLKAACNSKPLVLERSEGEFGTIVIICMGGTFDLIVIYVALRSFSAFV